ncbi:hypothetical protein [Actinokineospora pegani]|uniref:hypothetical protein n=1 Tax=Actinokineospora pegani TaxID=2654637 RepID=UPI0012E9DA34|nr:hypothetical protein [Actinokineospora pegani]
MAEIDLAVVFSRGWCTFALAFDGRSVSIKNHWASDRFPELLRCVNTLLDGAESVSCRWQGPVHEGHFIDLVADPAGGVSVAVHDFRHPDGSEFSEIWSAERGDSLFCVHVKLADFTIALASALRRVRVTAVDASGMIEDYPRPFPQSEFERIETRAARYGYHPKPLSEFADL